MQEDEAFKKRSALPLLIIGCSFWSITQTRSPMIHFPVNLFSANGERPVRTTFHFWFRLYSSQGIVLWDTCHLAPADGSLQRFTRKMLSCSLLFSDPFFLLNTLHYSLIFRFVKQFLKKYHVFSLKIVKIYFLTQKNRIFIIEEKAQNQKASAERWYFCMGYYDKERVRGFLHNQDGIMANDFGCFF